MNDFHLHGLIGSYGGPRQQRSSPVSTTLNRPCRVFHRSPKKLACRPGVGRPGCCSACLTAQGSHQGP